MEPDDCRQLASVSTTRKNRHLRSTQLDDGMWSAVDSKRQFSRWRSDHKCRRTDYEAPVEPDEPASPTP